MRKTVYLIIALFTIQIVMAQPEDKKLSKIAFLMVDKKYEDAAAKSVKLKEDPEYRKNGWVHYYIAQSYYEIAKLPELQEEYPKALKESLKAASKLYKYRNKPAENEEVYNEAQEFLSILKDTTITVSEIYYDNENYRKAAYYLSRIIKFDPNDYSAWLMKGVYEIKSRNIGEGVKSIVLAMDSITPEYVPSKVSAQTLVDALEEYAVIVQSGEYDKYFAAYKFNPTQKDVDDALMMKKTFEKYIDGEMIDADERKKESEVIFKSFKSDDEEGDEE